MQNYIKSPGHSPYCLPITINESSMTWFLKHANEVTFNVLECAVKPPTGVSVFPVQV